MPSGQRHRLLERDFESLTAPALVESALAYLKEASHP